MGERVKVENLVRAVDVPDIWPEYFNRSQWMWLMRHRHENGLDSAIVKLGARKLMLDKERFEKWLASRIEAEVA